MRLELFRGGQLYMSIEAIGEEIDFAILPKSLVKDSALSPKGFEELFFKCYKEVETHERAYQKAEEIHLQYFGAKKYSSFESFRISKTNRIKNDSCKDSF